MTTDFRFLCAELAKDLSLWLEYDGRPSSLPKEEEASCRLLHRARTALTESERIDPEREKASAGVEAQLFPWRDRDATRRLQPPNLKKQALQALWSSSMTENHPITPPPELVRQWSTTNGTHYEDLATLLQSVATQAARWGADQETRRYFVQYQEDGEYSNQ